MLFYMQLRNWFLIFVIAVMMLLIHQKSQMQRMGITGRLLPNISFLQANR